MESPAQTGLTYSVKALQCPVNAETAVTQIFYDQNPNSGTRVQFTCGVRCSSGEISTYTGGLPC